ncbi:MAG: hypothetical protein ABI707_05195 [Ferruginibacter sp.]
MRQIFPFLLSTGFFAAAAQNVGIGISSPNYKLDVAGNIHSSSSGYFENGIGINATSILSSAYKLQVNNGAIALYKISKLFADWRFGL